MTCALNLVHPNFAHQHNWTPFEMNPVMAIFRVTSFGHENFKTAQGPAPVEFEPNGCWWYDSLTQRQIKPYETGMAYIWTDCYAYYYVRARTPIGMYRGIDQVTDDGVIHTPFKTHYSYVTKCQDIRVVSTPILSPTRKYLITS